MLANTSANRDRCHRGVKGDQIEFRLCQDRNNELT